jgi:hypothetical protein
MKSIRSIIILISVRKFYETLYLINPLRPDVAKWQHFANIVLGFILKR